MPQFTNKKKFDPEMHQKRVKYCSKFLTVLGHLLNIGGWLTIIFGVFGLFMVDHFSSFSWYENGQIITLKFSPGFMYLLLLLKVISGGYFFVRQAREAFSIFRAIVKEYRDAEHGLTNGIQMVHRKSKVISAHKSFVKKITIAQVCIYMVMCLLMKNEFIKVANNVIVQQHAHDNDIPAPIPSYIANNYTNVEEVDDQNSFYPNNLVVPPEPAVDPV